MRRDLASYGVPDWAGEFLRFGVVGATGFVVNVGTLYLVRAFIGLYAGGLFAWVVAATVTWLLNRSWTFRARGRERSLGRQWTLFLAANFVGFVLYYGTYVSLVTYVPFFATQPIAAVFAGMIAGMIANFTLSRNLVFS
jgi:putative flippase GtrA